MADRLDAPDSSKTPDWSKPAEVGAKLLADTHGLEKGFNSPQFKQDLATANQWLHEHNFPNLKITGVDDKGRLITVDTDSHHFVLLADGVKPTDIGTGSEKFEKTDSGHQAKLNPDGSGIYKVADTDKSGWDLAKSILQDRGVKYPSATQIANFENQLLQANGIPQKEGEAWFKHLHAGQEIKVPALEGEGTAPVRLSEAPQTAPKPSEQQGVVPGSDATKLDYDDAAGHAMASPLALPGLQGPAGSDERTSEQYGRTPVVTQNADGTESVSYHGTLNDAFWGPWGHQTQFNSEEKLKGGRLIESHVTYQTPADLSVKGPDGKSIEIKGATSAETKLVGGEYVTVIYTQPGGKVYTFHTNIDGTVTSESTN